MGDDETCDDDTGGSRSASVVFSRCDGMGVR